MRKYIKITIFTLVCVCFNINKMYACDQDPIPVITSDPSTAYKIYMDINGSITLNSNSYDPDDENPYDGIVEWNWDLFDYSASFIDPKNRNVNSSFTFSPSALGLGPGHYDVDLNVKDNDGIWINGYDYYYYTGNWGGTRSFYVLGIHYFGNQYNEDVHYLPTGTGETFNYSLLPGEGSNWEPDILYLNIKDAGDNHVYKRFLFGSGINNPDIPLAGSFIWDGLGNQGAYHDQPLPPGNYTVTLYVSKGGFYIHKTNQLIVYQPQIKVNIEDSIVNDVSSGLDVSTLVFKLNNVEISHECLEFEPDYTGSILTGLEISYFPNASELILFGENTVVIDIDDNADNYMETLIQTFYLP